MTTTGTRGRKKDFDDILFIDIILKHRNSIVRGSSIVSKNESIWEDISKEMNHVYKASSIYSMVMGDKARVRKKLFDDGDTVSSDQLDEDLVSSEDNENDQILTGSDEDDISKLDFGFIMLGEDLEALVEKRIYRVTKRTNNKQEWLVFKPDSYKDYFRKRIFEHTGLECGFHIRKSYMNIHGEHGNIEGHCNCGSSLSLKIITHGTGPDYSVMGSIDMKKGKCGKPYLRNPLRNAMCENLQTMSTDALRAKLSNSLITRAGYPEPPLIPKNTELHKAKSQYKAARFLNKDLLLSLKIMKENQYSQDIDRVGLSPAYVQYSTPLQMSFCQKIAKTEPIHMAIDSGGGLVEDTDGKKIFGHIASIKYSKGEFIVTTMFSQEGNGQAFCEWLSRWRQRGGPMPCTFTSDWSRAILNGIILAVTPFKYVEEYAEAVSQNIDLSRIPYIRIDGAHTMAKYVKKTKHYRRPIKTFFKACIGRLIMSDSLEDAEKIIKNLFIVFHSETDGFTENGEKSACEEAKTFLYAEVTGTSCALESKDLDSVDGGDPAGADEESPPNSREKSESLENWAQGLLDDALSQIEEKRPGDRVNAFCMTDFAEYFKKDLSLLGLFSNVHASKFNVSSETAPTSGHVEFGFKHLKYTVFRKAELPLRLDEVVPNHIDYLNGRLKLDQAKFDKSTTVPEKGTVDERSQCISCNTKDEESVLAQCRVCGARVHGEEPCSYANKEQGHQDRDRQEGRLCVPCFRRSTIVEQPLSPIVRESIAPHQANSKGEEESAKNVQGTTTRPECSACKNFGKPDGSHKCIICGESVHPFEECSLPVGEEGYGQSRLCYRCHDKGLMHKYPDLNARVVPQSSKDNACGTSDIQDKGAASGNIQSCPNCADSCNESRIFKCIVCGRRIHASVLCSMPIGEPGPLQSRVCLSCHENSKEDAQEIAAKNDYDEWRGYHETNEERSTSKRKKLDNDSDISGKSTRRKKEAMYFGKNRSRVKDCLSIQRHARIPVLKNGLLQEISPIRFQGMIIRIHHTCAFDSLFQVILTSAYDFPKVEQCVQEHGGNEEFFKLVRQTLKSGVGSHSYQARGKMILKHLSSELKAHDQLAKTYSLNATTNIGTMTERLLGEYICYKEVYECSSGCMTYEKPLVTFKIDPDELVEENFSNILSSQPIKLDGRACKNCGGVEKVSCSTGPIVVINVERWEDDDSVKIKLRDIPQSFENPDPNRTQLRVSGVVEYEELGRDENGKVSAHYKPYIYRRGCGSWYVMDDLDAKVERVRETKAIVISLIVLCEEL
ncbi:hypothetical protein QAD02_013313 [Eretmocerus hayati]|uniref:Uncharacterized protein n=1 Tax=Eretmocerus hayati TaxID=131215 RepID=A0ACC2P274_9HYME|nr:hypothetical protein QAD02_013313 [Eretmocerus hayati]